MMLQIYIENVAKALFTAILVLLACFYDERWRDYSLFVY